MLVFVTGASGFIGKAVTAELLSHGHTVLALARSDEQARKLEEQEGVTAHRGSLDDLESLTEGAKKADGVIHLAFKHDFENYIANGKLDEQVTATLADALVGTDKPLVVTSGVAIFAFDPSRQGKPVKEDDEWPSFFHHLPRVASELVLSPYATKGVRSAIVRLPPTVHGDGDTGFVPALIGFARKSGAAAYVANAETYWPGVHRLDAAVAFRLALEKAPAGSILHIVGDNDGISVKDIATIIGEKLGLPVKAIAAEEAEQHFGWLGRFVSIDLHVSSEKTKEVLGWQPKGVTIREDLGKGTYF